MARTTRANRNQTGGPSNVAPPEIDPTGAVEVFNQRMEQVLNCADRVIGNEVPTRQAGDMLLKGFRDLKPETFTGLAGASEAEQWIRQMDSIFDAIECNDLEKKRLAVFQLTYSAADWWESVKATIGEDATRRMTWTTFKTKFLEKYFPRSERNKRKKEFIKLVQGNMTVPEYTTQFERLSRFAPYMVDTPENKNEKYHQGLTLRIQKLTAVYLNQPFEALVELAMKIEDIGLDRKDPTFEQTAPQENRVLMANLSGGRGNNDRERRRNEKGKRKAKITDIQVQHKMRKRCFNCGERGHHCNECPAPRQIGSQETRCYKCGRADHISKNCSKQEMRNDARNESKQGR